MRASPGCATTRRPGKWSANSREVHSGPRTGKEVEYDDIVKGYDLGDGEYVLVEQDELDEIAPGRSRAIDIEGFVDLADIDPIFFEKSYWLAPAKEEFAHAYELLLEAMGRSGKAGVARFVMRGKEHIAAIRAGHAVLELDTLLFAEDIRDPAKELSKLPERHEARAREIDMAITLIESMAEEWHPEEYHDTYTERVLKLVEDKKAGRTVSVEAAPPEPTKVVDLFEALSRSVESSKSARGKNEKAAKKTTGKAKAPDLRELSKAELDRIAREFDVKGRSKMSRAELEKAVRAARPSRRRAS
ncbi:Ku protein [Amycolatopsis rhizosphaerae]|uniref:Ku protein n=1 Tax=Amycolatopsis rhizosphaerae TaxID=2053003 RepID=A0A558CC97_9PSEU|nr:Ku protein [Amycolatopsis rhizosphaerae]